MQRQNVQRSIKRLMALGVLLRGRRSALAALQAQPGVRLAWSGKNHIATLDLERKKRMAKAGIKGVIEGGQQAPQEAPERDPNTLDMFTE